MSEQNKQTASRLAHAIKKLPKEEQMYLLGRVEAQVEALSEKKEDRKDG